MMKTPITDIWLAVNTSTKEYVFIEYGQRYDQKMYNLILPVSANEVYDLILRSTEEQID
ncbi:hypothetical protein vBSenS3_83 [Salmonella phage vB_SenS-3]|uniref:Uncharacterized protein n=4 Tax=Caudoviricetes TaxID=2731619 RepID=A0A2Z5HL13_9CAUD|nr:hypothetical protein HOT59_gp150 [Salmonella phage S113]AXC40118.1 hypothetical protein [Salmonella phage S113]QIN93411.1 hypothetical protein vBSenS3_83 [Salmonella phage vB_SenS-3]WFG41299.1 hypothetical protein INBLLOGA_00112 [Salmonella phage MET_P1_137_112]WPJ70169.1 hypothetical protein orfRA40_00152c [Salmonella phage RA40]